MNGILVINKPAGPTSRDEVNRVLSMLPRRTKLGHAGTLDPLASGVLVLAVGDATRLVEYLQEMPKAYWTRIRLGATSDSDDAAGIITEIEHSPVPSPEAVAEAIGAFAGTIDQTPPTFSAVKIDGQRAHDLARRKRPVEIAARPVRIDAIQNLRYEWPYLELRIGCGKGTYIRSIARDLGIALECGGYVDALVRESVGPFTLEEALPINYHSEMLRRELRPMQRAIEHFPQMTVGEDDAAKLDNGQFLLQPDLPDDAGVALFDAGGNLRAIGSRERGILQPRKVFKN